MKKSILFFAAIGAALIIAGLIGVYGEYQLSFVTEKLNNILSWLSVVSGCIILANIQLFIFVMCREHERDIERFKNQITILQDRCSRLYNRCSEKNVIKLQHLCSSKNASLAKVSNDLQRSNDLVRMLEKEIAETHVKYSLIIGKINA